MSEHREILAFTPPAEVLCIYHGNCADGFGAACVVRHYFGKLATFHAGTYGSAPPDMRGKHVYIVDFSYPHAVLLQAAANAKSVTILDHHKTAKDDLEQLLGIEFPCPLSVTMDMEHSGAMLAWDHFFPSEHPPLLIKHIEDRDLWRFALPGTREIQAGLFSYPYDFDVWMPKLFGAGSQPACEVAQLRDDGIAIERKHHKDIAELLAITQRTMTIAGHVVPVANLPYTLSSDAGSLMAAAAPFAACYWDTPAGRTFSLRSSPEGEDVAAIAQQYGGGGHRNAAGFRVPRGHELAAA